MAAARVGARDALPEVLVASVQVLTSSVLFLNITEFIDGVPQHVLQFKATEFDPRTQILGTSRKRCADNWDSSIPAPCDYLWQHAVVCGNKRVLEALDALSKTPRYTHSLHMCLVEVVSYAVLFRESDSDFRFLDWLYTRFRDLQQQQISESHFRLLGLRRYLDLAIVQWLRSHDYDFPASMMDAAAAAGNLALVRFLHEHGRNGCTTHAMDDAARHGHLEVVKFLHEHRSEGCTRAAQGGAMENGHLDVLTFLHEHRSEGCNSNAVDKAAAHGHLRCIEFAHEHGAGDFSVWTMSHAVAAGHLNIVKFLHEYRSEGCTLTSLLDAETNGHHDVVDFLCRHRLVANVGAAITHATQRGLVRLVAKLWCRTLLLLDAPRYEYSNAQRQFTRICTSE